MSRGVRMAVCAVGALGVAVLLAAAFTRMPAFGGAHHPYRDAAVGAAVRHATPNVVSSLNFDQRGLDTLVEEMILVACVLASVALLRPAHHESERPARTGGRVLPASRLVGYVLLPVTLALGLDVVLHGHLTPGGGFQGGVILATGLHLVYVTGDYAALRRLRPVAWYAYGEAAGAGAFLLLALAGLVSARGFMADILPPGRFGALFSAGTVLPFSAATGCAVVCGMVVLLAAFFRQELQITETGEADR
ncbi:MAG TPA: MnhB domain-containing protein [Streptosporangiaceae bacterium]|jgi:multicomponent Na+:H+ antiporter subunit B